MRVLVVLLHEIDEGRYVFDESDQIVGVLQ